MSHPMDFSVFRLKHLKGIGNKGLLSILQHVSNEPNTPWESSFFQVIGKVSPQYHLLFRESFEKMMHLTEQDYLEFLQSYNMVTILNSDYPNDLTEIYNPPVALFYLGDRDLLHQKSLAVIGSRHQTPFGREMIEHLLPDLIADNWVIVSGLAKGNDTSAHQSTIRHKGHTIGVIGCGLDVVYPKCNRHLQSYLSKHHLVVSEYLPGVKPLPYHFPARNRIIAGISKGVCVIEANIKSGTFITAELALEEGRNVFAVPGNPLKDASEGCLSLIQEGAKCTWKSEDILSEY